MKTKFIFITGGVLSSLGKGLSAASIGALLKTRGLTVTIQKLDPYINVDPGTMNPYQHGEVYVTDDGAETDLDLGHYERYLNTALSQKNNTTSGSIYYKVITKERHGDYLGGTVQVIPHITDEIKNAILSLAKDEPENPAPDVAIIEIGGTVGDIEGLPFLDVKAHLVDSGEFMPAAAKGDGEIPHLQQRSFGFVHRVILPSRSLRMFSGGSTLGARGSNSQVRARWVGLTSK